MKKLLIQGLQRAFTSRTLGIRGQRKKPKYQNRVKHLEDAQRPEEAETQESDEECNVEELVDLLQNAVLHPILKDATLNALSDKANQNVKTLLPNKPQKAATGRQARKIPSSKKKLRRILYASAQDLYKKKLLEVLQDDNLKKLTFSGNEFKEGRAEPAIWEAFTWRQVCILAEGSQISHTKECLAKTHGNQCGFLLKHHSDPDLWWLLILAGDIELNPGPVKWPCGYCGEAVSSRVWSIYCVDCKNWIHQRCAGMSTQEIRAHQNFRWHCGCVTVPTVPVAPVAVLQPATQTRRPRVTTPVPRCLKILQLNIDGWRGKVTSLNEFLDEKKIDVALLQETKLMSSTADPSANGWKVHRAERTVHLVQNEQPQGGLAVLVRPGVQSRRLESLNLPTGAALESLGVSVETKHGCMNLWNMYRPPATGGADVRDAALYLNHWPREKSSVICADVNAHGSWDANRDSDQLGEEIDDWLIDNSMAHVNSGIPTRVRQLGHAMVETAPDITIVHSSVASSCSWDVLETIGSDHLPIQLVIGSSGMKEEETKRKYNFNKTDWEKYSSVCDRSLSEWNEDMSLEKNYKVLIETMQKAAKESTPFTKVGGNRKPWWSSLCESAKRSMKDAFSLLRRSPCEENVERYKNAKKMFADTIREEKRRSWREFVDTLSPATPSTKVWRTLQSMDGRKKLGLPDNPVCAGDKTAVTDKSKAELAVKTYAAASKVQITREDSKEAYLPTRESLKETSEGELGDSFTEDELARALQKMKNGAAGPDGVVPQMIKHLPENCILFLLRVFNESLRLGKVLDCWKRAVIVPILKNGKPPSQIKSYRPVSLLPCIAKVLESMMESRVRHWAESTHMIPDCQSGFRAKRSTTDVLANLSQKAFDNLQMKKRTVITAVDFKGAFDRVWRGGLLRDLAKAGLHPTCLRWIKSFLSDRRACVRWNSSLSKYKVFQQGVPQGSPLSPLLFCLATASLPTRIAQNAPDTKSAQFADDYSLYNEDVSPDSAAARMQPALDSVSSWASDHYMLIEPSKTEGLVISLDPRETAGKAQPALLLENTQVPFNKHINIDSGCQH